MSYRIYIEKFVGLFFFNPTNFSIKMGYEKDKRKYHKEFYSDIYVNKMMTTPISGICIVKEHICTENSKFLK